MKKPKFLLFILFSLISFGLNALPENNSILRLESKNSAGEAVFAVVVGDEVRALTVNDEDYSMANSLWLVSVNTKDETFTLQNVGTGMYLKNGVRRGDQGAAKFNVHYLAVDANSAVALRSDANEGYYYYEKDIQLNVYIQYDPNKNEWRFYQISGGHQKHDAKNESQSNGDWSDEDSPRMDEEQSMEITGSKVDSLMNDGDFTLDDLEDVVVDYVGASDLPSDPIVVGELSTYPQFDFWKTSTIQLVINSLDWIPISFPVDVKCVTADLSEVYYQYYDTEKRSRGEKAWVTNKVTSTTVFYKGVAYNFATDTKSMILDFQFTVVEDITRLASEYRNNLNETTGNGLNRDKNWYYIGNALFLDAKMNNAIDYACVYNGSGYVPVDLDDESFAPFSTFFVQYAGDYAMSSVQTTRNSAPMLAKEKSLTEKYSLRIDGENSYYKTGIYFAGGASAEDYVVGEDFLSFATKKGKGVEIYTVEDDADYSFNKRPIENTVVRVGMYVGTAGRYTISLDNISGNAESMILYDTYEQDFACLHLGETYRFYSERGEFNDRFGVAVTYAPEVPTDNISLSANKLIVVNNEIQGLTLDSELVVYDAMGHLVYVANVDSETMILPNLNSGIYIARNGNGWVKFVIK